MLEAADLNEYEGRPAPKIICVEPYPSKSLRTNKSIELIPEMCQNVPVSLYGGLRPGDLLFIDSSHSVKVGSDVVRIYLDIIPTLPPDVTIHIHDIYLPYVYPRDVFARPYWWQETTLLTALLINNPKITVLSCLSALHYDYPSELGTIVTDYRPAMNIEGLAPNRDFGHFPSSLWLRTK